MRTTEALATVAVAMMQDPSARFWGYQLSRETELRSGILYPILQRMLDQGWLVDGWETFEGISKKRPPRRYYTLTTEGAQALGAIAAKAPRPQRAIGQARLA